MQDIPLQNLGNYLKDQRISIYLTQAELAKAVGVHVQFVSNWERGLCAPPSHCFHDVMDILKVDLERVVDTMLLDSTIQIEAKVFEHKKLKSS